MVDMGVNIRKKLKAIMTQACCYLEKIKNRWHQLTDKQKNLILASGLSIFAICIWLQYGALEFHLIEDMGIYLYGGKELLQGNAPYVHVFDVKPPLTFLVSAGGLLVFTNILGLPGIFAIRIVMLIFGAGTIFFTYLLTYHLSRNRIIGILSAIILLSFTGFGWASLSGEPKLIMIFFAISCLYMLYRKKWLISGLLATLSALTWQPAGIFPLIVISYSLLIPGQKRKQFIQAIFGAILPIILVALLFFFMGGLQDMIDQTVFFVITFKKTVHWGASWTLLNFVYVVFYYYGTEVLFFICGFFGFILLINHERKNLLKLANPYLMIMLAFLPLFLYSFIDLQGWPDLISFLPFISIFASYFIIKICKKIAQLLTRKNKLNIQKITTLIIVFSIVCSSAYGISPVFGKPQPVKEEINNKISEHGDISKINQTISKGDIVGTLSIIANDVGLPHLIKLMMFTMKTHHLNLTEQLEVSKYIENSTNLTDRLLFISTPELIFLSNRKNFDRYILYPADIIYMEKHGELTSYYEKVIEEKPVLIIGDKKHTTNTTEILLPSGLDLYDFINREYNKVKETKNYIILKRI